MNDYIYNYTMMDADAFQHYLKQCEREGIEPRYTTLSYGNYGVMLRREKNDNTSKVVEE